MKRLTISNVDKPADRRKAVSRIAVTAAAASSAVLGAQQLIGLVRRYNRAVTAPRYEATIIGQYLPKHDEDRGSAGEQRSSDKLWDTPLADRPVLVFDKGETSQILEISGKLFQDSPAAAIALMDFVAMHQSSIQPYARARLTTLLQMCNPRGIALRSAKAGYREMQQSHDGRLTVALSHLELGFLQRISGETTRNTPELETLSYELQQLIAGFRDRDSQRRQGAARVVLADVLLRLGRVEDANQQMSQALVLLGTIYSDSELILLSVNVNGASIIDLTFGPSSDEAQQKAHLLVADHG